MRIIAIAGGIGSGKTTLAKTIKDSWPGSEVMTMSTFIIEKLRSMGNAQPTRAELTEYVQKQRRVVELEYWTKMVIEAAQNRGIARLIVDGVRTPCDAKYFLAHGGTLIFIDAPLELRFQRVRERARVGEPQTEEGLWQALRADWCSGGEFGTDLAECRRLATENGFHLLHSDRPVEEIRTVVETILREIERGF